MRLLLTACATTALVAGGPLTATAAGQGSQGPVGGDQLTAKPTVVADGAAPPAVQASAYVVADVDTGAVLAAKAPHAKLRPASTLKTLTALVLLPRLKKTDQVVGTDADAGIIGSKVGVYPGLTYTVDLLFQGMFLASGNDAVHALCAHDEGGVPAPEWWDKVSAIRDVLESDGRTLAQGALAWLWARSPRTVPIPGFRTVAQAEENAGAMALGPLSDDQMTEIAKLLAA